MIDLGLSNGGGNYIRFLPSVNGWQMGKNEVVLTEFVLLPETLKTGWGKMAEGQAPEWSWDAAPGKRGDQPSPDHKRGFSIKMIVDGEEVEWSSTGTGPVMGFQTLYSDVVAGLANNPGKVPVVKFKGSEALKVGKGSTRKPHFEVLRFVDPASVNGPVAAGGGKAVADAEF